MCVCVCVCVCMYVYVCACKQLGCLHFPCQQRISPQAWANVCDAHKYYCTIFQQRITNGTFSNNFLNIIIHIYMHVFQQLIYLITLCQFT